MEYSEELSTNKVGGWSARRPPVVGKTTTWLFIIVRDERAYVTGEHRAAQVADDLALHEPRSERLALLQHARAAAKPPALDVILVSLGVLHTGYCDHGFGNANILGQIPRTPWFNLRINDSDIGDHQSHVSAVHLVATRFCLGQGNLTYLVAARLELFKAVCLPSMAQQRLSASFLWVIYIDTTLASWALADLKRVLKPYPLFVLVRIGGPDLVEPLLLSVSSNLHMLGMRAKPPPDRKPFFISSRIDADDGLARGTIGHIQMIAGAHAEKLARKAIEANLPAANRWSKSTNQVSPEPLRGVICWRESVWWVPTPFFKTAGNGIRGLAFTVDHGRLKDGCITPGLTTFSWGTRAPSVQAGHHRYIATLKTTAIFLVQQNDLNLRPIRARSVTSNSMDGVGRFHAGITPHLDVLESTYNEAGAYSTTVRRSSAASQPESLWISLPSAAGLASAAAQLQANSSSASLLKSLAALISTEEKELKPNEN
eukprot:CAMPEP_0206043320 /NCGR_PEP_ID=MMETSP1466-20131121/8578_1 /ASSEMBLY_ACC=CAM_ASM_001126 /TAXON_ID=44452 /ORGANISM="Pavlova gyrans, Strain CCMP608" /LENGTH=484 /DNA_ID=CAMNT_0053418117 /DNA_START=920 /DNA_END=2377 /DNA_ORIENTATION=-